MFGQGVGGMQLDRKELLRDLRIVRLQVQLCKGCAQ